MSPLVCPCGSTDVELVGIQEDVVNRVDSEPPRIVCSALEPGVVVLEVGDGVEGEVGHSLARSLQLCSAASHDDIHNPVSLPCAVASSPRHINVYQSVYGDTCHVW
jgi:hypothetical protein